MGALGMGAMVYLYWNPAARQKAANAAQLVLGDAAADMMLLLGGVAAGAKEEWSRVKEQYTTAKENDEAVQTVQVTQTTQITQTTEAEPLNADAQPAADTQIVADTLTAADTQDAAAPDAEDDEPVQVVVKLGSSYAAKTDD
jgi:hypothetical protein